ncbi:MAG: hypothetical protein M1333_03875 [Patescibacteria group bacterium]|nr:hypothetical protein [Patescibacteria group bacterium]
MKTKIIVMLCLTAGLVVAVFLANRYHWFSRQAQQPAQVQDLVPQPETKVYPEAFPKELVFDMSPIDSVSTLALPGGKQQTTVKYLSLNPSGDFARGAKQILEIKKWVITTGKDDLLPKEIVATKDSQKVTVSLSPIQGTTAVTVVYEK